RRGGQGRRAPDGVVMVAVLLVVASVLLGYLRGVRDGRRVRPVAPRRVVGPVAATVTVTLPHAPRVPPRLPRQASLVLASLAPPVPPTVPPNRGDRGGNRGQTPPGAPSDFRALVPRRPLASPPHLRHDVAGAPSPLICARWRFGL